MGGEGEEMGRQMRVCEGGGFVLERVDDGDGGSVVVGSSTGRTTG